MRPSSKQTAKPQPQPKSPRAKKSVQLKTTPGNVDRQPPTAPPAYRPQPVPKVLQRKTSPARNAQAAQVPSSRPPAAPPVYRPQPTPRVLQPKKLTPAGTGPRTASVAQLRPAPQVTKSSTVQLSKLVRRNFSAEVRKTLVLKYGQHRRHIIPNHLMKNMLQNWWNCHEDDDEGENTTLQNLQILLDQMNNYIPNLIPGEGKANSAIGMLSNNIGRELPGLEEDDATPMEIAATLGTYGGFQQQTQRELMEPVLKTYKKDPDISTSHEDAFEMAEDIHFSADFDWPGGKHFDRWKGVYDEFKAIEADPENVSWKKLLLTVTKFQKLPSPKS